MKKIITYLLFSILSICAFGQTRCNSGDLDIDLTFKRCVANNNVIIIDFIVTNMGKDDFLLSMIEGSAYDDEGNCYRKDISFDIANTGSDRCTCPSETPLKLRCYVNNIDEFATNIVRLDMIYSLNYGERKVMVVKNIPFSRE